MGGMAPPMNPTGAPNSQYMVDRKGKPYTIVYKNGKPKKKKWKGPLGELNLCVNRMNYNLSKHKIQSIDTCHVSCEFSSCWYMFCASCFEDNCPDLAKVL